MFRCIVKLCLVPEVLVGQTRVHTSDAWLLGSYWVLCFPEKALSKEKIFFWNRPIFKSLSLFFLFLQNSPIRWTTQGQIITSILFEQLSLWIWPFLSKFSFFRNKTLRVKQNVSFQLKRNVFPSPKAKSVTVCHMETKKYIRFSYQNHLFTQLHGRVFFMAKATVVCFGTFGWKGL